MPILRDESGIVYTAIDTINRLIAPSEVGIFEISAEAKKLVEKPLDKNSKIYSFIPSEMDAYCRAKGLMPSVAITYWSGCDEKVHDRVKRSRAPHTNSAGNNELHFVFAGAMIIYVDNGNGQYAVLLQPGDWIYIDGQSEAWPKLTHEKYFTLASYHSAPLAPVDEYHKELRYTETKEKPIL